MPEDRLTARVTDLEILLTHLEQRVQELNDVVRQSADRQDQLARQLKHLLESQQAPPDDMDDPGEREA